MPVAQAVAHVLALPAPFAEGFDSEAELLPALARCAARIGLVGATVFPEWYASYVFVVLDGRRWIIANKYRPLVAIATVEPTDRELAAVPASAWTTADAILLEAFAPRFRLLTPEELVRPPSAAVEIERLIELERRAYGPARTVAELLFNNLD